MITLRNILFLNSSYYFIILCFNSNIVTMGSPVKNCSEIGALNSDTLLKFSTMVVPVLGGGKKGEAGKICVIGGSIGYTGAPHFAALASLKVGADLVYVITSDYAAPIISSYSPELLVFPFLSHRYINEISNLLGRMDVIVIGPGFGREPESMELMSAILLICKDMKKPLIIDADGIYIISQNISLINDYPKPGLIILTPNHKEEKQLKEAMITTTSTEWYTYWGDTVFVLSKGEKDQFFSSATPSFNWTLTEGGSGRRVGGQGDVLAGTLGTFLNWALKTDLCDDKSISTKLAVSAASYAAAKLTRTCNEKSFAELGRSMTVSHMLTQIHNAFKELFIE